MATSNLSAAAEYVGEGLDILPLTPLSKIPLKGTNGVKDASDNIDPWEHDNNYNIGMACGASGIVVIDFDFRNGAPPVDSLFDDDDLQDVIIVDTPSGGVHLWFKQPDTVIGCPKSTIAGIDIKGNGGYVVVPPSKVNGKHYTFRSDHELTEIPLSNLAVLPQHIIDLLIPAKQEWARTDSAPIPVEAEEIRARLACIPPLGTYDDWLEVLMAVHSAYPDEVGVALCEEWSPGKPGEIAKKFASFKKGGRGIGTLIYLSNKYGYVPPVDISAQQRCADLQSWCASGQATALLRTKGVTRPVMAVSLLDKLAWLAQHKGSKRIVVKVREIARDLSTTHPSIIRWLDRLQEYGMIGVENVDSKVVVDLSPILDDGSVPSIPNNGEDGTLPSSFLTTHAGHDAFGVYSYKRAVRRRQANLLPNEHFHTVLLDSLGRNGLLLWEPLADGGTISELAEASGLSKSAVRRTIQRYIACELVEVDDHDKELAYVLKKNAEEILEEKTPEMVTYGVGQVVTERYHTGVAHLATVRLRQRKSMTPKDIMWWENLRDQSDRIADAIHAYLLTKGIDSRAKVGNGKQSKPRQAFDAGEEWRSTYRPMFDQWRALGEPERDEFVRLITLQRGGPDCTSARYDSITKEVKEEFDTMVSLSYRRLRYERTAPEPQEELPHTEPQHKLQLEMELG